MNSGPTTWTPDREAKAKRMFLEGVSYTKIAKELGGVTRNAVCGKLHRMGVLTEQRVTFQESQRHGAGILPTAKEQRGSGGAVVQRLRAKAPDPEGMPKWAVEAAGAGALAIDQLERGECRWPMGPIMAPALLFCAEPTRDGDCPYCPSHARRAFTASDNSKAKRSDQHVMALTKRFG